MIKECIHRVFSVVMAFLVLVSTVSFTVEKRYCHDDLIDVAVFTSIDDCEKTADAIPVCAPVKVESDTCCKDKVEILQGQNLLKKTSFDDLELEQQLFLYAFTYTYINLFEGLSQQIVPHKDYSPPNLVVDIQVLDEVFLI